MDELTARIQANLADVQHKIESAARSAGRDCRDIRLVVVTKSQPGEVVEAVLKAGAPILGENYPEETLPKILALQGRYAAEWHMIGHLQSRKARIVAEHFQLFQSLDRLEIAEKLNQQVSFFKKRMPVLLEFNVGGEESKSGWDAVDEQDWEKLLPDIRRIISLPNLEIRGLMTMPPLLDPPELARPHFVRLRKLRDFLAAELPGLNLSELSMGTSSDYQIGIEEGATLVRIGTAIVGPRVRQLETQPHS